MNKSYTEGIVVGNIMGDGHLDLTDNLFAYSNTEPLLVSRLDDCFGDLFNYCLSKSKKKGRKKHHKDIHTYSCYSKKVVNLLSDLVEQDIFKKDKYFKIGFLKASFDDEGSISKRGTISIVQKDEEYIILIKKLLFEIGIKNTKEDIIFNKIYQKNYYQLRLSKVENKLFNEKIGFLHPNKNERLKNNLIVKNMGNTILNVFNTQIKIIIKDNKIDAKWKAMIRKVSNSYVVTVPMPFIKRFKLKEKDIIEVVIKLEGNR